MPASPKQEGNSSLLTIHFVTKRNSLEKHLLRSPYKTTVAPGLKFPHKRPPGKNFNRGIDSHPDNQ
jgi:hypothetical protein